MAAMPLDLDPRRRAMLREMGVHVWSPATPADAENVPPAPPAAARAPVAAVGTGAAPSQGPADVVVRAHAAVPTATDIDAMDWPALAQSVQACQACGLCVGRKAAVFVPEATPRQADWLIVGEPPDALEERDGTPFAGDSAQLLDNMLRALRLSPDQPGEGGVRVTNVVKCRPSAVRNPHDEELAHCAPYLRREIALVQPRVIVAMGRFAARALLAEAAPELVRLPFGKLRGQVHRYQGLPVIVTYHPAKLLRSPAAKAEAWADLCLALSLAKRAG